MEKIEMQHGFLLLRIAIKTLDDKWVTRHVESISRSFYSFAYLYLNFAPSSFQFLSAKYFCTHVQHMYKIPWFKYPWYLNHGVLSLFFIRLKYSN